MFLSIGMLKQKYFLADIFILSAEKQPIKLSWRKIECLPQFQGSLWSLVLHVRSPVLLFPALAFSIPFLYTSIYRFSAAVQPAVD